MPARAKAKAQETAERLRGSATKAEDRVRQSAVGLKSRLPGGGAGHRAIGAGSGPAALGSGSHLAEVGHDAVARTGARLSRVSDDQWRHVYLPAAAATVTVGAVAALSWARHRT